MASRLPLSILFCVCLFWTNFPVSFHLPPLMFWTPQLLCLSVSDKLPSFIPLHPHWCFGLPTFYIKLSPELTCNNFSPQVKTLLDLLCLGSSQTEVFCRAFMLKQEVTLSLAVLFEIGSKSWHCSGSHLNVMVNWSCRSGLSHTATTLGSVWLMRQLSYSSLLTL